MSLTNLDDVFLEVLKDTLDAEKQILKALPKMVKGADSEELKAAFEEHRAVTEQQVERLASVFETLGKAARGKHCPGMEGLLEEGAELIKEEEAGPALDAALIVAAQKVEHYEIAAYGSLVNYAKMLGNQEAAALLSETLKEEKDTDTTLTKLASRLNFEAQDESDEE
jgi:ferritin-like metal-binding protein YciE